MGKNAFTLLLVAVVLFGCRREEALAPSQPGAPLAPQVVVVRAAPYVAVPQIMREPVADLDTGASGGSTDLVDSPNFQAAYVYYDKAPDNTKDTSDDRLLFRMRVGKDPAGAFGYSFLIDTDLKVGCATAGVNGCTANQVTTTPDPNYVAGNPGFELEVILATGKLSPALTGRD